MWFSSGSCRQLWLQLINPKTLREYVPEAGFGFLRGHVTSPAIVRSRGFFVRATAADSLQSTRRRGRLPIAGRPPRLKHDRQVSTVERTWRMPVFRLTAAYALLLPSIVLADWTAFRGAVGDGDASTQVLPTTWSESDGVLWKVPLNGQGWSSPVVADGQVWATSATADGRTMTAHCLDLETGQSLWTSDVFEVHEPREIHTFNTYSSPTPTIDAERVYLTWGSYGTIAIDRATFKTAWVRRDLPCHHWRGPGSSPVLDRAADGTQRLFQHYDGYDFQYLVCLDATTGDTIWRTYRPRHFGSDDGDKLKAYATPLRINAGGREQLISPTSYAVFSYDPTTGDELWRCRYDQFSSASRPLFDGKTLYVTTGFGKGAIAAVDPTGSGDVTDTHRKWVYTKTMPSKPSPALHDGVLFCLNDKGVLVTLDAESGEKLTQMRLGGNYSSSPLLGRTDAGAVVVYLADEAGKTHVVTAAAKPEVVAENTLESGMLASPVPVDGTLVLKTKTHVYRVGTKSP